MSFTLKRCFSLIRTFPSKNFRMQHYSSEKLKTQEIVPDYSKLENEMSQTVFEKVNQEIVNKSHGRLFAVVQVSGKQHKITTDDLIVVRNNWPPTIGDKIRLEKVLLVGCSNFTLIGRPLLPLDQVLVVATVIEKTLTHTITHYRYTPRKNDSKLHFFKDELTYLRINSIELTGKVNELGETDGFSNRIF